MKERRVESPRPQEVPGFAEAVAAGITPARPSTPPAVLPGTTAHQALVRCGVSLATFAVPITIVIVAGRRNGGQLKVGGLLMMLSATAVAVAVVFFAVGSFRRVLLAELAAGYVTTTFHQGMFWFASAPGPKVADDVVGWVWDGVWVLTSEGAVVSAPNLAVEPPGFYPSPHRPGQLELWTGSQWTGVHADNAKAPR